jgi:hypothetical protein
MRLQRSARPETSLRDLKRQLRWPRATCVTRTERWCLAAPGG